MNGQVTLALCIFLWHAASANAQRDLKEIPTPDPVAEQAAMKVADGFEVNLFASDPDITKPIHMNWDSQGRLWVATSKNYPQLKPGAKPTDEIIVLEDTDGDGRSDKRTVFADDLMIPTGILPGDGGVYVANSTELIHLKDTNGDGKADQRKTILAGFGTEDTHHLLHTLRWRPDGRMAFNQSIYIHSHIDTPYGTQHLDGGGIWHFNPRTYELDIFCKGFVNPWGHAINSYGQSFVTDGAYFEGINYAFPGAVFATSPGASRWLSGLNPGSPKHCGLEISSGPGMPASMQGVLLTNDFRGHRVCRFRVERFNAGYRSEQLPELIVSSHIAFRPIDVKMGPDGAIYIADWYNPIIQHGEVDFRDERRDTEHGRIWRVSAAGMQHQRPPYEALDPNDLQGLLSSSALWERDFARQHLVQHAPDAIENCISALKTRSQIAAKTRTSDASATTDPRVAALWLSLSAGKLDVDLLESLASDAEPRFRALATRVLSENAARLGSAETWLIKLATDPDPQVVLEAVCGLEQLGTNEAVRAITQAASRPNMGQNLDFAVWKALSTHEGTWMAWVDAGELELTDVQLIRRLADASKTQKFANAMVARLQNLRLTGLQLNEVIQLLASKAGPNQLAKLCDRILNLQTDNVGKADALQTWTRQIRERNLKLPQIGESISQTIADAKLRKDNFPWITALVSASVPTQAKGNQNVLRGWLSLAESENETPLIQAILSAFRSQGVKGQQIVRQIAEDKTRPSQMLAVDELVSFDQAAAAAKILIIASEDKNNPDFRPSLLKLFNRKGGPQAILSEVRRNQKLQNQALGREVIAVARKSPQSNANYLANLTQAFSLEQQGWQWSPEFSKRILQLAAQGNAKAGESIYRRSELQCIQCHAIGQSGLNVGPNLVSLAASSTPEYILESLLAPAAKVKEGFETINVLTEEGAVISGLKQSEDDSSLNLKLADGTQKSIPKESIEERMVGKSLMPAGLLDKLSENELIDLTAFLLKLGKAPEVSVDTQPWIRNWTTLVWTAEANRRLNRTSMDTAATDDPSLQWRYLASMVDGQVPINELQTYQPHRQTPSTAFVKCKVTVQTAGKVHFQFQPSSVGLNLWLNGKPLPIPGPNEPITLDAQDHEIVVGIQSDQVKKFGLKLMPADSQVRIKL